jgi:hypothetical protein
MLRVFIFTLLLLQAFMMMAQAPVQGKYWIEFKDKNGTPFCTSRPAEFLSARAIARRERAGIAITEEDLPVSPLYIAALRAKGARLHGVSRWLNAATVVADSATAAGLRTLPFIDTVQYVGKHILPRNPPNRKTKSRTPLAKLPESSANTTVWGYAVRQNAALGIPLLHLAGHRGRDIRVVVMDGGFTNVDTLPFFDSLALNNRLFVGYDFVERDQAVFESAQHGTSVLSVMGANLPGYFVGTAPEATFFLVKTEDTGGEFPIEEANWIAGAEWADSIGADIINASLGYTAFNDARLSHTYRDLNGHTAIGSRGATIAAQKGMIICNSAGNSGDEPWHYIGVPADAPGIIAVGATNPRGKSASFSSTGPTADGRIKPDLSAPGESVITAGVSGTNLGMSNGTSLASPMLAGAIAALWSAYPEKTAAEIEKAVFEAADQYQAPDSLKGYGLPNLSVAWLRLGGYWQENYSNSTGSGLFAFDRNAGELRILENNGVPEGMTQVTLYNILGQKTQSSAITVRRNEITEITLHGLENLPPGYYTLALSGNNFSKRVMALVWK